VPGNETYFKAFAAAKKAVEFDQQSPEAHASLAFVIFWGMWDAADAEKEFRRAIELDPKKAKAHHWYATFLHALVRFARIVGPSGEVVGHGAYQQ
jgi:Tfp pilus assembly protein PilF